MASAARPAAQLALQHALVLSVCGACGVRAGIAAHRLACGPAAVRQLLVTPLWLFLGTAPPPLSGRLRCQYMCLCALDKGVKLEACGTHTHTHTHTGVTATSAATSINNRSMTGSDWRSKSCRAAMCASLSRRGGSGAAGGGGAAEGRRGRRLCWAGLAGLVLRTMRRCTAMWSDSGAGSTCND